MVLRTKIHKVWLDDLNNEVLPTLKGIKCFIVEPNGYGGERVFVSVVIDDEEFKSDAAFFTN